MEPSELQRRLYEDFSKSGASRQVASVVSGDISADAGADPAAKAPHVFQASHRNENSCKPVIFVS